MPAAAQCTGCPNASFFPAGKAYQAGDNPFDVATADFNRDGLADVLVSSNSTEGALLLLPGNGRGGFDPPKSIPTSQYPQLLAVGDLNHDGFLDVVHSTSSGEIVVLLGGPAGTFGPPTDYAVNDIVWKIAVGDLNGDQRQDVVVVSQPSSDVSIFLATEGGALQAAPAVFVGTNPFDLALTDLNSDSKLDLVVSNRDENVIAVRLGNGDGSFLPRMTFPTPVRPFTLAVGRFNGDAYPDLVVSGYGFFEPNNTFVLFGAAGGTFGAASTVAAMTSRNLGAFDLTADGKDEILGTFFGITVLVNNGSGSFAATKSFLGVAGPFVAADFNSDGRLDIAGANATTIAVFLGDGLGGVGAAPADSVGPVPTSPRAVAVGDFNGDGLPDAVATSYFGNSIVVLLRTGSGSFTAAVPYSVGSWPTGVVVGNFDGDMDVDVATVNETGSVSVLFNNGSGVFGGLTNYQVGFVPKSIVTADFNHDGKRDLAVANSQDERGISVLLGDGAGNFGTPINTLLAGPPSTLASADFNGDQLADLAAGSGDLLILLSSGNGSFQTPVTIPLSAVRIATGDLNLDGKQDLAVLGYYSLSVLLGDGTGGFGAPLTVAPSGGAQALTIVDFDLDGVPDLGIGASAVSFFRGTGTGAFTPAGIFITGGLPSALAVADFNQDGRPDVIAANESNDVSVLLNTNCKLQRLGLTNSVASCNVPAIPFEKHPVVRVFDDGDNVVSCGGGAVQASILPGTGSPGASLQGTTSVGLAAGTAAFSNLAVNLAGQGYVLQFSRAGVVSTRSRAFRVDPGCKGPFQLFTVTPCRVVDTRTAPGIWGAPALAANSTRVFPIAGRCGIPITARSVATNVTVVSPTDFGHLTLFPAGYPAPLASTINFRGGIVRANNAILSLGDAGDVGVQCAMPPNPANHADFLIDVSGYFE